MVKWIAAVIGYMLARFPGAIVGFLLGNIIDYFLRNGSAGASFQTIVKQQTRRVSPGDFELNLLSLASLVIKADGRVNRQELDYVRTYFLQSYGKEKANAIFRTFNEVVKNREVSAERICMYLCHRTRYEVRLQILHFLFSIAKADGVVSAAEADKIRQMAAYLRMSQHDFESIKAMFFKSADDAYKILEIEKSANDAEVKKAYRQMVKKYHPDKLQHMDEIYQKGAQEKFTKVQEAYDKIQKERGF